MIARFTQSVAKVANPVAWEHLVETILDWFESAVKQARERDADFYHSTTSYFTSRRVNIGVEPSLVIFELGLSLPDVVWRHSVIMELRRLVADMTFLTNVSIPVSTVRKTRGRTDILTSGHPFLQQGASSRRRSQ